MTRLCTLKIKNLQYICVQSDKHLLGNLEPGFLEAENRAAVQGGGDLEDCVVVMQAATDVGHSYPFLYDSYPSDRVVTSQDLCGNQVAHLTGKKKKKVAQI